MTRRPDKLLVLAAALLLGACAIGAPAPDWKTGAASALDGAVAAWLVGDTRVAEAEFARARREIARTGRPDTLARVELIGCAARVASLDFEACAGFEKLRPDAGAAELAYADYLAGRILPRDIDLLPPAQRRVAAAGAGAGAALLVDIDDPFARLVAAGVLFERGWASPAVIEVAVDTASAQGWRRPLLSWLHVQLALADKAGDTAQAGRLRRRIELVAGEGV